jgi:NAD+ synthase (glutamine-hydrolysing)
MNRKEAKLIRVAAGIPDVRVADIEYNVDQIVNQVEDAKKLGVDVLLFPELSITGYTCGDLFHNNALIKGTEDGVNKILVASSMAGSMVIIVGSVSQNKGRLYNSALVIQSGMIVGTINKKYLPNYKEFYEKRWFSSDATSKPIIFTTPEFKFGIEICEDVWSPCPPSVELCRNGADIIFNLSASNELVGKHDYLVSLLKQQSARCISGYVYSSSGYGESSQDLVYAGNGIILENGKILESSDRFMIGGQLVISDIDVESIRNERIVNTTFSSFIGESDGNYREVLLENPLLDTLSDKTVRTYNGHPFIPAESEMDKRCAEILNIQSHALAKRLDVTKCAPVIGISGGSDSTLALMVALEAMKKLGRPAEDIIGVTMPGFATSKRTLDNSILLMGAAGITQHVIDIKETCRAEMKAMGRREFIQDITFENIQARTRTAILMNTANQKGGLVIGTGDLSELALGWCTYNADQMSMYAVNTSIPKTLVKVMIKWYASVNPGLEKVLSDILATPVSPELVGTGAMGEQAQVTEDKIGPYELHDFFLYNTLRHGFGPEKILYLAMNSELKDYGLDVIKKWLILFYTRFFSQQFKRSCMPDGPKVGSISLSPRGDWRMPSDASSKLWIELVNKYNGDNN